MKNLLLVLASITILFHCCKSDDDLMGIPVDEISICDTLDCPITEDLYGIGFVNGECWTASYAILNPTTSFALSMILGKGPVNGINESFRIILNHETDLTDTIWLGWTDFVNHIPNIGHASYSYREDHSSAGGFSFTSGSAPSYQDFLIIDYINEDTSIVEGRFQVNFPENDVSGFVTHAPDSMRIECGQFRAMNF